MPLGVCFLLLCALKSVSAVTLAITGDVNLNPILPESQKSNYSFVWGNMLGRLRSVDLLCINHESTIADVGDNNPATIQFEDPLQYTKTYGAEGADIAFMATANNHQFDFHLDGLLATLNTLTTSKIAYGGVGHTKEEVQTPRVISRNGLDVAFFTMVIDECWKWPNGTLYLDACTCGTNAGLSPYYQCYQANGSYPGEWYHFGVTDELIADRSKVIAEYRKAHPTQLIVTFLHFGPNFQWQPYPEHEQMLRNLSAAGSDIVWGTSSHHIQKFEFFNGSPIVYGLGDLLFRHFPGVSDFCPLYAVPCAQYRPDLALVYVFDVTPGKSGSRPTVSSNVSAWATTHTDYQAMQVTDKEDIQWIENVFNEMSNPGPYGAVAKYDPAAKKFLVHPSK